jgi:hypothetical protein
MTLTDVVVQKIIRRLLKGEDYRVEIVTLINAEFLQYALDFFGRIVEAKLRNNSVTADWYKAEFLNSELSSDELIINSGLNKKTVSNMYNSARRAIVLEASNNHYDLLNDAIGKLVKDGNDINLMLTIKSRNVSVDLNINESLIVINTLAVKRAELRGGAWSSAGKQVEKSLMRVLCKLHDVPESNYELSGLTDAQREVDFCFIDQMGRRYKCEVKLMGKGNPESADATIARDSNIFIADKLSNLNKKQLNGRKIRWIELRSAEGFRKLGAVLQELRVPHNKVPTEYEQRLVNIFHEIY